jgi:hypothetical protein
MALMMHVVSRRFIARTHADHDHHKQTIAERVKVFKMEES